MAREVDQEEVNMDMTPMIDVVFLLIIFFILMPPKKMEGKLESYLPQSGSGASSEQDVKFYMVLRSQLQDNDVITTVTFNHKKVCEFITLSIPALDAIYNLQSGPNDRPGRKAKDDRLAAEHKRDDGQFDPKKSSKVRVLINKMVEAANGDEKGKEADVMIDASSNVPFKVVLCILNAGTGAGFPNLKFAAPDKSIWNPN
jgi:biopolymer transport protein ExbD